MAEPRDALFWAEVPRFNFAKETRLAQDKRGREQANASSRYAKGELTRAAPLRYAANRNQANNQGLLESGQLAQRQGQTQADFANKQSRITEQRKAAIERLNEGDSNADKEYNLSIGSAEAASVQRQKEQLERNPPAPAPEGSGGGYPSPAAQQAAINRGVQPGPGGVVPYEGNGARVGPQRVPSVVGIKAQPNTRGIRAAAAAKALTPKQMVKTWGVG